ncbi:Dabb family protein [Flavobacteriaceae bacterium XHP0103]|uniref:Dabb family protein n=1 Tax=Marixanthotalea marina TaxID=2844359 RepID=UPI00384F6CBF|nr:Dabb family protein [Marixanthotalea marina]
MKKLFYFFCISLILCSCGNKENNESVTSQTNSNPTEMTKQLRHVVLFKFKESSSAADINKVETAFEALPSKIKEIKDLEWGLNNSPEGINKGFTHCFFVTFDSEEDRAIYLPHPAHKAFVDILSPHLDDVLVIDYWNR